MKKIDLHTHTIASDGSFTPQELVKAAVEQGLAAVAITDHDSLAGVQPALEIGKELEIEVVPGIELTTYYQGQRIDILGYYIDLDSPQLNEVLDKLQRAREVRAKQILAKLANLDVELDFKRLKKIAGDTGVGRPHIARLMVEDEYVTDMQTAFDDYLEDGGPAYVPKYQLTPSEAVKLLKQAGGIPVLAHPGVIDNRELVIELLEQEDFAGIEAYYSQHNQAETDYYLQLATEYDLLVTGGSDCHGPANEDKYLLGRVDVPYKLLEQLKKG
ncbi:putative metal-dependent phosphoesterase, PHP family [Halobacteroides halobius DSM 5150]|uniref:Putative metal-dependent phosphoesterase, PHP family n=1 Tax=Halobacteroides halobius (strain ATCC 35273 / DSM 5150 / MD-1) TaxID=748449 RepID=L0KAA8_HALHC|nr:PHP domain-containing protein [Halobacteroides halobius]AGB42242.1 putative metal-dependent phosphoesterase, PHP family [Halobacteroides halobius DSM 5150]